MSKMKNMRAVLHLLGIVVSAAIAALTAHSNGGDVALGMATGGLVNGAVALKDIV